MTITNEIQNNEMISLAQHTRRGSASHRRENCLCMQMDKHMTNQRNEACEIGSSKNGLDWSKARPSQDTQLRLAGMACALQTTSWMDPTLNPYVKRSELWIWLRQANNTNKKNKKYRWSKCPASIYSHVTCPNTTSVSTLDILDTIICCWLALCEMVIVSPYVQCNRSLCQHMRDNQKLYLPSLQKESYTYYECKHKVNSSFKQQINSEKLNRIHFQT